MIPQDKDPIGGHSNTNNLAMFEEEPPQQESIRVCLRLRPLNKFELKRRSTSCVIAPDAGENIDKSAPYATIGENTIKIHSPLEGEFNFKFDRVLPEDSRQSVVYEHAASHLASRTMEGFNCALIAYGQTGSGKTHTMMGGGEHAATKSFKPSKKLNGASSEHGKGMIHLLIKDVFRLINDSPPSTEYIVRCSFVEIYLERILDLLNPTNRTIQILSCEENFANVVGGGKKGSGDGGVQLIGASEACCIDESDVASLLVRGNACRTVSSTKLNTDSSRSHAIFIMKIEQKDSITGISKVSQLQMIDMAGSELGGKDQIVAGTKGGAIHQEARMINKSISLLNTVLKTVVENQTPKGGKDVGGCLHDGQHRQSKLTHLLKDLFGGNCHTSVILTASPSSYNISETIRTVKFGHLCQGVKNFVKPSVEMSPVDYRKLLNESQKKQGELLKLVSELKLKGYRKIESPADDVALQEELSRTRKELENSRQAREKLENIMAERQSEVAVLRTQNDIYASEKKKYMQELVAMKDEMRVLTQRKQEVEHNLRTSQFREYEATVFLRQFRRFYRRLLKNKAHQGTGRTSEVIENVPGVPDLNDLIDVDSLLLEAGLIEESELQDDTATGAYRPSAQALGRSTDATNKSWKEAALHGKVDELVSFDRSVLEGQKRVGAGGENAGSGTPHGQSISNRQQFLGTPAGRLTTMRERELERDLLRATEKCIDLQVALNEEKANVDVLTNRAGNKDKKKLAQESIQLKQQLDKKTHDLQAIIWKMNELHLINKTYNEKMSNREQHVTYLEENLVELQNSNRNMTLERQEAEGDLRAELDNLKVLVNAMTVPLWQFGECGITGRTLASRIRLPVCGGECNGDDTENDVDDGESVAESFCDEEDEDSSEDENELESPELPSAQAQNTAQSKVLLSEASTQTDVASVEKGTMTDMIVTPQHPTPFISTHANAPRNDVVNGSLIALNKEVLPSVNSSKVNQVYMASNISNGGSRAQTENVNISNEHHFAEEYLFTGGMPAGSQPRRFVHKYGSMIRPACLKMSKDKKGEK
jgi:hypothetical protein